MEGWDEEVEMRQVGGLHLGHLGGRAERTQRVCPSLLQRHGRSQRRGTVTITVGHALSQAMSQAMMRIFRHRRASHEGSLLLHYHLLQGNETGHEQPRTRISDSPGRLPHRDMA